VHSRTDRILAITTTESNIDTSALAVFCTPNIHTHGAVRDGQAELDSNTLTSTAKVMSYVVE